MYKIATLNKISPIGLDTLGDGYEIIENPQEANGILVRSFDMLDMEFSPELLAVARAGAGVNNIPLTRCAEEGIVVFNTPGANANAVKELVIAALLADARNLYEGMSWVKTLDNGGAGEMGVAKAVEKGKGKFAGHELKGKTICIIGLGAIGVLAANACEAIGMKVVGFAPFMTVPAAHEMSNTIPYVTELGNLLADCDYVSVHVPASPNTNGMINAAMIDGMKEGATLLNFSRDKLVDETAVLAALAKGKLRKYITDFPNDTVLGKENVMCIPHLGASTEESEDNCATMAAMELKNYLENGNIANSVNFPACSMGHFFSGKDTVRVCILSKNIPELLSSINGVFSEMNISISSMSNASQGAFSYTMLETSSDVDIDALKKKMMSAEGIIRIRVIK